MTITLPAFGTPMHDGVFTGVLTNSLGQLYAPILLDALPAESMTWKSAINWAKELRADLPNRAEGALMFRTVEDQFDPDWYWTNEVYDHTHAWFPYFGYGTKSFTSQYSSLRARAVRRLLIQSFDPFVLVSDVEVAP